MGKVELLAPAGSPEALAAAVGEGADGVYLGLKSFNARMRSANFAYSQFEGALRTLHRMGRKLYVTVNTVFEQREADRVYQLLNYLSGLGPDGIIVQDFGILRMARDNFPSLKLHASTQMNIASARGGNALSKHGVSRVVLARELSLGEIRDIRGKTNLELEVFVHGALCVSVSGLCLFSSFLGGKSANRGMCTQACRRIYQDGEGQGYYFSPADLQLLERVPDLIEAGVNSFKIEGRMKSAEYVGTVVAAYRRVLDGLGAHPEKVTAEGLAILRNDFARTKTAFYFDGVYTGRGTAAEGDRRVSWLKADQDGGTGIPLGTILKTRGSGGERRGLIPGGVPALGLGDSIRLHRADDSERRSQRIHFVEDEGKNRWVSIPEGFETGDSVYLIQTKGMSKRYPPVIPQSTEGFRRLPGREKAPDITLPGLKKNETRAFPEGFYGAVSEIEALYVLQAVRPVRVLLTYNCRIADFLLGEKPSLPFSPGEIILALDPYFPQAREKALEAEIPLLMERGYCQFVVNNPGHFSYFRGKAASLIAGPYLYTFNRWALAFVASLGTDFVVSPLENNRQNLERTVEAGRRAGVFITLFAYPALFRIRANLGEVYRLSKFQDSRGEQFRLINNNSGSLVIPEKPFYIGDKTPFLKTAGFSRFILDFSGPVLKKKDYKDIMAAVRNALPLPNTCRFNWKDGFYTPTDERVAGPGSPGTYQKHASR
ncbi:MAG: U32 family peptidase [Spirochaetaceae bacterium]|jgi:putative protease|nr:U32 family peptidase [Spirochaetaceae bacterium]